MALILLNITPDGSRVMKQYFRWIFHFRSGRLRLWYGMGDALAQNGVILITLMTSLILNFLRFIARLLLVQRADHIELGFLSWMRYLCEFFTRI